MCGGRRKPNIPNHTTSSVGFWNTLFCFSWNLSFYENWRKCPTTPTYEAQKSSNLKQKNKNVKIPNHRRQIRGDIWCTSRSCPVPCLFRLWRSLCLEVRRQGSRESTHMQAATTDFHEIPHGRFGECPTTTASISGHNIYNKARCKNANHRRRKIPSRNSTSFYWFNTHVSRWGDMSIWSLVLTLRWPFLFECSCRKKLFKKDCKTTYQAQEDLEKTKQKVATNNQRTCSADL